MKKKLNTMESLGIIFTSLFLFAIGIIVRGYTAMYMWNWFIKPLGFPSLTFVMALGFCSFIALFKDKEISDKKEIKPFNSFGMGIFLNLFSLLIGYIISLFL